MKILIVFHVLVSAWCIACAIADDRLWLQLSLAAGASVNARSAVSLLDVIRRSRAIKAARQVLEALE